MALTHFEYYCLICQKRHYKPISGGDTPIPVCCGGEPDMGYRGPCTGPHASPARDLATATSNQR